MIPDDVVEEVRERADLVGVVGEVVELQRSGKDYKARCPFHDDRTPSFYVVPDKGFYKCFGCDESGDVFAFVMKRHGMDFVEAVKYVGARSGVEVREVRAGGQEEDPHRALREANAFAQAFFSDALADPEKGRRARDYLRDRGIDEETAERFQLGYAPSGWRNLTEAARRQGVELSALRELGLVLESEKAREPYDRFRDRVIFPIDDPRGRVVAFGGRVLGKGGDGVPKYVNSPESPIYRKGETLYGLARARRAIRKEASALLVEGYMDAVAVAAAGLEQVVAALGTSLTEAQARLLSRYTRRVLLLFDPDAAGLRAAFRAGDLLLAQGVHPSVVTLEPGVDPDDLVRARGPDALREHLDQAIDILDRKLQILEERDYFGSIERTRQAVDRLLPTLRATRDPALRDIYLTRVAEKTGVRRETLEAELEAGAAGPSTSGRPGPRRRGGPAGSPPTGRGSGRERGGGPGRAPTVRLEMGAERQLLLLLVSAREWIDRTAERLGPEDFRQPEHRQIFEALVEDPDLDRPPDDLEPGAARRLRELLEADPEELRSAGRVFEDSVNRIRARSVEERIRELDERIRGAGKDEDGFALLREKERLRRELGELRPTAVPDGGRRDRTRRAPPTHGDDV